MEEHLQSLMEGALSCPVKWGYFSDGESLPRVTLFRMSGRRNHTLNSKGLMRGSVQVDCWGATFGQATLASREVRDALEGYAGGPILHAGLTAIRDRAADDASTVHRVSLTFDLTYRE